VLLRLPEPPRGVANDCLCFLGSRFEIGIDCGIAGADDRSELTRLPDVAVRNPWRAFRVQQQFRSPTGLRRRAWSPLDVSYAATGCCLARGIGVERLRDPPIEWTDSSRRSALAQNSRNRNLTEDPPFSYRTALQLSGERKFLMRRQPRKSGLLASRDRPQRHTRETHSGAINARRLMKVSTQGWWGSSHIRTGLLSAFPANKSKNREIQHFGYFLSTLILKTLGFLDIYDNRGPRNYQGGMNGQQDRILR